MLTFHDCIVSFSRESWNTQLINKLPYTEFCCLELTGASSYNVMVFWSVNNSSLPYTKEVKSPIYMIKHIRYLFFPVCLSLYAGICCSPSVLARARQLSMQVSLLLGSPVACLDWRLCFLFLCLSFVLEKYISKLLEKSVLEFWGLSCFKNSLVWK